MTTEQKLLLQLLRCGLQGETLTHLPEADWQALNREACAQAVFLPVFDVISQLRGQLPEAVYQSFFQQARRMAARNINVEFSQAELVKALQQLEIPYVILKGEAAAADHPKPHLRQLGDVDFMVPVQWSDKVIEKINTLGYTCSDVAGEHHMVLKKSNARLELHREVAGMPTGKHRQPVEAFLSDIYEKSRVLDLGFGTFRAPSEAHHGLILLLHTQHHGVFEGIGLRHILDWACYVTATAEKPFWNEELLPLFRQVGLLRFACVLTKMSAIYFGSSCPDWAMGAEESLCRELMEDILAGGNFGRKDKERSRAGNMLPDWEKDEKNAGRFRLLYRTLRKSVLRKHPQWKKKPVRLFFAMTGKAIRYGVLFLRGKRPNLLKAASFATSRRSVYEQLRLFETENQE